MLDVFKNNPTILVQAEKFFNLILRQMTLMQTFVDDLLDIRQIKEGAFKLVNEMFDPNETLSLVYDIFV